MSQTFDIVIIGGGAAGIGAAMRLAGAPASVLLLEASDRLGGRARTDMIGGAPLDLGCGYLHSAGRNAWTRMAEARGAVIDRTPPPWEEQFADLGFTAVERREAGAASDAFEERLRTDPPVSDRASDALEAGNRWNAFLEAMSGYRNGASLGSLSIADYLAYEEAATDDNWRLPDGFGALVASTPIGCEVRLAAPVTAIDHSGSPVRVSTSVGVVEARQVILCVPTATLGRIRFHPGIPDKLEAASVLPLGLADKAFLALDGAQEFPPDSHLIGSPRREETGSYFIRPFGRPMIEAFYGGAGARTLADNGRGASHAFAVEELVELFGSDMRKRLRSIAASDWSREEWIGGSYSHALPGHAGARSILAESVGDRLHFAGEAGSATDFSTAHGAFDTGVTAAERAVGLLPSS